MYVCVCVRTELQKYALHSPSLSYEDWRKVHFKPQCKCVTNVINDLSICVRCWM